MLTFSHCATDVVYEMIAGINGFWSVTLGPPNDQWGGGGGR